MSGRENLISRINYAGGKQKNRMVSDKEYSLKKALLYSYQSATAILNDGREFLCLINPNKLTNDYDDKIISIPFKDICLNGLRKGKTFQGQEDIGMKSGDVFQWKENNSYWLVSKQHIEEYSYFRASIRRCRYEIDINGHNYKVYARGPVEQTISWSRTSYTTFNNLNYTLYMQITANEETLDYFHRFKNIKFNGNNYEVQVVDNMTIEGVIEIYCKEDYSTNIADTLTEINKEKYIELEIPHPDQPQILGDNQVYPYDTKEYQIKNANNGQWKINNKKAIILEQNSSMIKLQITSGKSGNFVLSYENENNLIAALSIDILSL